MSYLSDSDLYDGQYFDGYYLQDPKRDEQYKQERKRILALVKPANILDIGCGVGGFLAGFDDRWTKYGYDPSEFATSKARNKGINMLRHYSVLESDSMDVVVLRGVLQHMDEPMKVLFQATRILKRGGLLVILATPNTNSIVYKIWGKLPPLDAPRNWIVFSDRILDNILERLGYAKRSFNYPYIGTPYAHPLKDMGKFMLSLVFGWRKFAFWGSMFEVFAWKD